MNTNPEPHDVLYEHFKNAAKWERFASLAVLITFIASALAIVAAINLQWKPFQPGAFEGHRLASFYNLLFTVVFLITAASAIRLICRDQRKECQAAVASLAVPKDMT